MRLIKLAVISLIASFAILLAGSWYVAGELTKPATANIGDVPKWLDAQTVEIQSDSGAVIRGWLAGPQAPIASVLLLHPVRGNRRSMLGRARFLIQSDYQVLLVDLQAHGASDGDQITFGHLESLDASAAVRFMKRRFPEIPVFVIGSSLGGAAAMLATPPLSVDGLVVEAVYPTIDVAIENRLAMRLGVIGEILSPALMLQFEPRLGISSSRLRPADFARRLTMPVYVISGQDDAHTTVADTKALYDSIAGPKEIWLVPGAAHGDLHAISGKEYERRVLRFFSSAMKKNARLPPHP